MRANFRAGIGFTQPSHGGTIEQALLDIDVYVLNQR